MPSIENPVAMTKWTGIENDSVLEKRFQIIDKNL